MRFPSHRNTGFQSPELGCKTARNTQAQENKYAKLYFPIDGNTLLECLNTSLNSMSRINVITVSKGGKAPLLDIEIAKKAINDN